MWTTRSFKTDEPITWYDGNILVHQRRIAGEWNGNNFSDKTHFRSIQGMDMAIDGLKISDGPLLGRGGGSFINHLPERANCRYSNSKSDKLERFCPEDNNTYEVAASILIATRPVFPKEELFINYGHGVQKFLWWQSNQQGAFALLLISSVLAAIL